MFVLRFLINVGLVLFVLQPPGRIMFELIGTSLGAYYFDIRYASNTSLDVIIRNSLLDGFRNINRYSVCWNYSWKFVSIEVKSSIFKLSYKSIEGIS